jgi:acyl carrier protein
MEQKFIELFKEVLEIEDQEVNLSDKFRDFDNWDSLTNLSLIAMLDDEFGFTIQNSEFKNLITISDLIEAIKAKVN